jgi:hypothetical protein
MFLAFTFCQIPFALHVISQVFLSFASSQRKLVASLLAPPCASVCLSAGNNQETAKQIFMKFDIWSISPTVCWTVKQTWPSASDLLAVCTFPLLLVQCHQRSLEATFKLKFLIIGGHSVA